MSEKEPVKAISEALERRRHTLPIKRAGRLVRLAEKYDFDRGDVAKGAAVVGTAAVGVFLAREAYKRHKAKSADEGVHITDQPAHHMPDAVSIIDEDGSGGSLPRNEEALDNIHRKIADGGSDVDLMKIDQHGRAQYPLRDGIEQVGYKGFVVRARGLIRRGYDSLAERYSQGDSSEE